MITTTILFQKEDSIPIWHKNDGFAKNEEVAKWLFAMCGWNTNDLSAELLVCEEEINWPQSDYYFPCDMKTLWVLGSCLHLN